MAKIEVYLNRKAMGKSKKRIYSLREKGLVKFSNNLVLLENVDLVVQESGRQDTLNRLSSKAKISRTVHSFLRGKLLNRGRNAKKKAAEIGLFDSTATKVGYDPRKTNSWVCLDDYQMPNTAEGLKKVVHAAFALLHPDGILVLKPE